MLKKFFWAVVAVYLVFLVLINSHPVPFRYFSGEKIDVKLDLIVVLSFAAGILSVLISDFIGRAQKFFSDILSYSDNKKKKRLENTFDEAVRNIDLENYKKAKELLVEYIREEASNIDAYVNLANIYLNEGLNEKAEETLKRASVASKDDVKILKKLCGVYVESKKYDKAIKTYKEIMEKEEDKTVYLKKIYDIYFLMKDYRKAYNIQRELEKNGSFKDHKKEFIKTKYHFALSLIDEGQLERAEDTLKSIISDDKRFYGAYVNYAASLVKRGEDKEALMFLRDSYEDTKFPYFARMIEELYLKQESPKDALMFYQSQIDRISMGPHRSSGSQAWKDSQALMLYALYVNLLIKLEMIDYAIEAIDEVVGIEDDKKLFHFLLAECYLRHQNYEGASMQYHGFLKSKDMRPIMLKCDKCGAEYEDFDAICARCGTYNKINYYVN